MAERTIPYEPGLDGLRAVCITGVLLFHVFAVAGYDGWVRGGGLGVSVFFTLSGFLITTLLVTEYASTGGIRLWRFWGRRVQRLVAASLVVVVAVMVLTMFDVLDLRRSDALAAIWSATNWHVIASGESELIHTIVGPLGPTWSLAVEEQFYLGLVLVCWWAVRRRRPERTLAVVFVVATVLSVVLANVVSDWQPRLEFGTDVRMGELAIGCLLALGWRRWGARAVLRRPTTEIAGWLALGVMAILFLFADYSPPWLLRGGFVLVALVSATVITSVMAGGSVQRVLALPPLVAVGRWSYALYLVHWPTYLAVQHCWDLDGAAMVVVGLALAFAIAVALHLLVEQPLRGRRVEPRTAVAGWLVASVAVSVLAFAVLSN